MIRFSNALLSPLAAFLVSSCTTDLSVEPLDLANQPPLPGWTYSLPFAQFDVTVSRRLKDGSDNLKVANCAKDTDSLQLDVTITATPRYERDPKRTYLIDYRSLSNAMKTSDLQFEKHDNEMIKSLGAESVDRTREVVVNTLTGVVKLTKAAFIAKSLNLERTATSLACNGKTEDALTNIVAQRKAVMAATDNLDQATTQFKFMSQSAGGLGQQVQGQIQSTVFKQAQLVASKQMALEKATAPFARSLKQLTIIQTIVWPENGNIWADVKPYSDFSQWLVDATEHSVNSDVQLALNGSTDLALKTLPSETPQTEVSAVPLAEGIRYRAPVRGSLTVTVCKNTTPPKDKKTTTAEDKETTSTEQKPGNLCTTDDDVVEATFQVDSLPQLGRIYFLPFHNGPFQSNVLKASFANDGRLISAGYTERLSQAEVASDTLNQVADQLLGAAQTLPTLTANTGAEILKAKTAEIKAEEEYQNALVALTVASEDKHEDMALIEADTALKNALKANIEADLALMALTAE